MNAQARRYAEEFAGVFAPGLPPHGWEQPILETLDWPKFDRWADDVLRRVDSLFDRQCEAHICAAANGNYLPKCEAPATVSDRETELTFCAEDYKKFQRGKFDAWR